MKKYTQVILIIVVALLICMGCTDELLPSELHSIPVFIRNMSTVSGVTLSLPMSGVAGGFSVSLDPSPQAGIPVDSSRTVIGPHLFYWSLKRTIDSVVVASGEIYIESRTWVLIEEDGGEWSCTWSDEPLW